MDSVVPICYGKQRKFLENQWSLVHSRYLETLGLLAGKRSAAVTNQVGVKREGWGRGGGDEGRGVILLK